jgi:hypothetical protein
MINKQELFQKFDNDVAKRSRLHRCLLALDQMGNVLFMNGSQDETISSHIARKQVAGTATKINNLVCYFLRKLQQNHCIRSEGE